MRKIALAAIALGGLVSSLAITPAHAATPDPWGAICQFASVTDPTVEGQQSGQVSGGPLVLTDDETPPGVYSGTLTCRVQVTTSNHTGSGPSVSGHGTPVVTAGPSTLTYSAGLTDNVYLCSEFTDDATGTTYYFDDTNSLWSTSNTVDCGLATSASTPQDDPLSQFEKDNVDPVVCPVLVTAVGGDGDVAGVWDCPPYA